MKNKIRVVLAVARGYSKKIDVVINSINIKINGKPVKEDEDVAYEEIRSFFKAYDYEDTGYNQWLKFTR